MKNNNELIIHIMQGYDSIETPDGTICFGAYIKNENEIYVASDIPDNQLFHTLAHEYCHYLQERNNREFDEEEAEAYANMLFSTDEHDKQVRTDDIEECIDILNNSIPLVDNKDIVFGFKCAVERLEQLKEHNEQNSIIEALKPRGCDDMPKEIICNCTKELTYREIFEHFLEKCETKSPIEDYRPCIPMYGVPDIPYAIVIWLADGTKIIYIDK